MVRAGRRHVLDRIRHARQGLAVHAWRVASGEMPEKGGSFLEHDDYVDRLWLFEVRTTGTTFEKGRS